MKKMLLLLILISLFLSSCAPVATPEPTSTLTPTVTSTLKPTETPTPEKTPTATATIIPDFMKPYFDGGYDKMTTDELMYIVYDENSVKYAPGDGIIFNERIIRSWTEVYYVEDGVLKHGIVLDFVLRGGNELWKDFGKFVWAGSGADFGMNPSFAYLDRTEKFLSKITKTSYPIMKAPLTLYTTGDAELYEGIFPTKDRKLQPVTIPGIGVVLPFTSLEVENNQLK